MLEKAEYRVTETARALIESAMQNVCEHRDEHFGNARAVRNLFEHIQQEHANRLASVAEPSREELMTIQQGDIERAWTAIQPRH